MTKTFLIAAVAIVAATGAQAASFGTQNSFVSQRAAVVNSLNVAIGEETFAAQGTNSVCGTRNSTVLQSTAVVNSLNVAIGEESKAMQGANHVGGKNCLNR